MPISSTTPHGVKEVVVFTALADISLSSVVSDTEGIGLEHNTSLLTVPKRERRRSIFARFFTNVLFAESRGAQQPKMARNKSFTKLHFKGRDIGLSSEGTRNFGGPSITIGREACL